MRPGKPLQNKVRVLLSVGLLLSLANVPLASSQGREGLPGLIKRLAPSIVVVRTYDRDGKPLGQGTGFFVDPSGHVITNHHVLRGAFRADVKTYIGKVYSVRNVLAEDEMGDLIRVSVEMVGDPFPPLSVSSLLPEVGEHIIVIGTPLGLEKTVSDGIVSAVREIPNFGQIVQLTAPISPGSSGSPVLNMKGEVIGIATFLIIAGQNLNFAIPGERILRLNPQEGKTLTEWGSTQRDEQLALVEELYTLGLRYLWVDDFLKALSTFIEVVKKNPAHGDAYFQIGYCYAKLGRYPDAIEAYERAIRLKPNDADTYNNLCVAYGVLRRYEEAIACCERAVQLRPDQAGSHNNLAWTYHQLGRYREAIQVCLTAIQINPNYGLAYYNLGNNYLSLSRYEDAISSFRRAIQIKPDHAESHLNLGASYAHALRFEEAIEAYKLAVRIKPDLTEAHLNLGMAFLRVGDKGSALDEYKILKDLDQEMAGKLFQLIYE